MANDRPRILIPTQMLERLRERAEDLFDVVYVDRLGDISDAEAAGIRAFAGWGRLDAALIDRLPKLEIIANYGVGYDGVDAAHAAAKGIMVTNTPEVLSEEVADVTIALLINTLRELPQAEAHLREGRWLREGNYPLTPLTLRGRHIGIYGLGRIGREIARRLEGFGVTISYHARNRRDVPYAYHETLLGMAEAVDTLVVAVPGGADTEKSVGTEVLRALGPQGVLINIGRGTVVDEAALVDALRNGTIAAAGLDVFADEPRVPEELTAMRNVSLLPHVASASVATRNAMADLVVDNLKAWFGNEPVLTPVAECAHLEGIRR